MRNFCTRICHTTFSCNNQFVYAVMRDGIVLILDASHLCPRFEIDPSTYIPSDIRSNGVPLVIAAHPEKSNQFALGWLSLKSLKMNGWWMTTKPK
nr:protein TPR3-like [Ipomoea batatas]